MRMRDGTDPFVLVMLDAHEMRQPLYQVAIEPEDVPSSFDPSSDFIPTLAFHIASVKLHPLLVANPQRTVMDRSEDRSLASSVIASIGATVHNGKPVVCLGLPQDMESLLRRTQAAESRSRAAETGMYIEARRAQRAEEGIKDLEALVSVLLTGNAKQRAKARRAYRKAKATSER
jgi:hypothetical protein